MNKRNQYLLPFILVTSLFFLWAFLHGRFSGTLFMKYIRPPKLLGIYALIGTPFFMSIMFPTIFAMGISELGEKTWIRYFH